MGSGVNMVDSRKAAESAGGVGLGTGKGSAHLHLFKSHNTNLFNRFWE